MSDEEEVQDDEVEGPKGLREKLKRETERASEAEKKLQEIETRARSAELKSLMAENDVPLNPRTKFALQHYQGDLEVESVRTFLQENGMIESETPPEELAEHSQAAQVAAGAGTTPEPSADYEAELAAATSPEAVMEVVRKHNVPTSDLSFEDSSVIV